MTARRMGRTHRMIAPILAATVASVVAGCSAGVEQLPLPAPGLSGPTYELSAEFANALNLPDRAKVRVGGADVGEVVDMTAEEYTAVVQMRILDGVRLPAGTTAELRSATPLGDVFVALTPPAELPAADTAMLGDGAVIPLAATAAAATVEQVLATTSLIVNGGVIRNLTRVLNGVGSALGSDGQGLSSLIQESRGLVSTMADRSDEIRDMLERTAALADDLNSRRGTINDLLDSSAPALLTLADNTAAIVELVNQLGAVTDQLQKFPAIQGTDTRSWIRDLNTLSSAFNETATDPRVTMANIMRFLPAALKLFGSNAAAADVDLQQIAIGHIPDMNHAADPGFTGPKWENWDNMVGSIRFVITQLGDRVWGPDRGRIWGPPQ
ncbi:putative Mce family protein [Mycolicibacterium chitae]|nr:MlaD family protein [Mycolicibacterium chitae]MCV7106815.1 MCE family protein [Mycolicibacterium chitae]BBZ00586.1 putative Mce family protein [Mycolicibacterium chitae]